MISHGFSFKHDYFRKVFIILSPDNISEAKNKEGKERERGPSEFLTRDKAVKEIHIVTSSSTSFSSGGWTDYKHNQPSQLLEKLGQGVWKQVSCRGSESEQLSWKRCKRSCITHFTDVKTEVWRSEGMCPCPHGWYRTWIQDQALTGSESPSLKIPSPEKWAWD